MEVIKEAQSNFLKVGNKYYYADGEDKTGNLVFKEVKDKKKFDLLTKKIIPKLKDAVNIEEFLTGALAKLSMADLEGVYDRLYKSKKKAKPKQTKGCLKLKVGRYSIPLQD